LIVVFVCFSAIGLRTTGNFQNAQRYRNVSQLPVLVFTIFAALWGYYRHGRMGYKIFLSFNRLFYNDQQWAIAKTVTCQLLIVYFPAELAKLTIRHKNGEQRVSLIVIPENSGLNIRTDI
jgi:hypothetical protein